MRRSIVGMCSVVVAVALVACGGGSAATSAPGGSLAASAPPAATGAGGGSSPSAPSSASAPAASEPGSGGGTAAGVCELATTAELAPIFAVTATASTVLAGPPDTCIVKSGEGRPLVSWVLDTQGSTTVFDTLSEGAEAVAGLGDRAQFVENVGLLVQKGDSLLSITIAGGADLDEAAGKEAAKAIATLALGRM